MKQIDGFAYQVSDHGCDHAQYFPGVCVAFTRYTHVALGSGSSARAAGEDALEQFWQNVDKRKVSVMDAERLEQQIHELSEEEDAHKGCEEEGHEECEWAHYVSIRWTHGL